ncbi:hypothetical protein [Streptomyces sp. NPDC047123]
MGAADLLRQRTATRRHHTYEDLLLAPRPTAPDRIGAEQSAPLPL